MEAFIEGEDGLKKDWEPEYVWVSDAPDRGQKTGLLDPWSHEKVRGWGKYDHLCYGKHTQNKQTKHILNYSTTW